MRGEGCRVRGVITARRHPRSYASFLLSELHPSPTHPRSYASFLLSELHRLLDEGLLFHTVPDDDRHAGRASAGISSRISRGQRPHSAKKGKARGKAEAGGGGSKRGGKGGSKGGGKGGGMDGGGGKGGAGAGHDVSAYGGQGREGAGGAGALELAEIDEIFHAAPRGAKTRSPKPPKPAATATPGLAPAATAPQKDATHSKVDSKGDSKGDWRQPSTQQAWASSIPPARGHVVAPAGGMAEGGGLSGFAKKRRLSRTGGDGSDNSAGAVGSSTDGGHLPSKKQRKLDAARSGDAAGTKEGKSLADRAARLALLLKTNGGASGADGTKKKRKKFSMA